MDQPDYRTEDRPPKLFGNSFDGFIPESPLAPQYASNDLEQALSRRAPGDADYPSIGLQGVPELAPGYARTLIIGGFAPRQNPPLGRGNGHGFAFTPVAVNAINAANAARAGSALEAAVQAGYPSRRFTSPLIPPAPLPPAIDGLPPPKSTPSLTAAVSALRDRVVTSINSQGLPNPVSTFFNASFYLNSLVEKLGIAPDQDKGLLVNPINTEQGSRVYVSPAPAQADKSTGLLINPSNSGFGPELIFTPVRAPEKTEVIYTPIQEPRGPSVYLSQANNSNSNVGPSQVNITVGKNTTTFIVDAQGNAVSANGVLQEDFGGGVRSSSEIKAQAAAAARGVPGDQGGHLVGYRFLPEQGQINSFPQDGNFNLSAFKKLENDYARYIKQGYSVVFNHTLGSFNQTNGRPGSLNVDYTIKDSTGKTVDSFSKKFNNTSGQTYDKRGR